MSSLFSSPSKTATAAANAQQGISDKNVQQAEDYVNKTETQLRNAIPTGDSNPYFNAAGNMNPAAYKIDPGNTQSFQAPSMPSTGRDANQSTAQPPQALEPPAGSLNLPGSPFKGLPSPANNPFRQKVNQAAQAPSIIGNTNPA